jgi:hypothetical protein
LVACARTCDKQRFAIFKPGRVLFHSLKIVRP